MHPPGETQALEEFVAEIFRTVGLDWKAHANCDPPLTRPSPIACGRADSSRAAEVIGWRTRYRMPDVMRTMVEARPRLQSPT
jgi:GDPmannose 4,6-dehydratase